MVSFLFDLSSNPLSERCDIPDTRCLVLFSGFYFKMLQSQMKRAVHICQSALLYQIEPVGKATCGFSYVAPEFDLILREIPLFVIFEWKPIHPIWWYPLFSTYQIVIRRRDTRYCSVAFDLSCMCA